MSGFVVASSWDHAPVSSVSPPYASRDGLGRPPNAVIDVQDPQLHAPVTFALTDLEPTAGLQSKLSSRAAGGSGGPTFRVCEPHITLECPLGSECADAHVSRAALSDVRTSILKWLADKEHEFGQQVASCAHSPISYKIFCSDLKEIVDVPVTSITFTRGLFADPGVRTNKRQTASSAQGSCTGVSGKAADVNSAAASTPTACGLFASDPALCKWGKWCNQAHIDPQFLSRRKQVFNQWAMGHESTFNTMPPDAVFLVHDPVIKRSVDVKRYDIAEFTRGLFQQSGSSGCGSPNSRKAPSLCLLYQKRRCTAGTCCNQIHVKPEAVTAMRMVSPQTLGGHGEHASSTVGPSQRQKHSPFGHNPNNGNMTNNSHLHHLGHQQSGGDGGKRNVPGGANNVFAPGNFHVNSGSSNGFAGGHGGGGFIGANHQHPHPHMYSDPFGSPTTAMGINGFVGQPPQMNGDGRAVHQHFFASHPNPNPMGIGNYSNNPPAPNPNHFPHSAYGQGPRPAGGGFPVPIGIGNNNNNNNNRGLYHGGGGAPPPTGLSQLYPSPSASNGHEGVGMNMRVNTNNNNNGNDTNTLTQHQRMYHNPQGQHYHQNAAPPPSSTNSSAAPQLGGNVQPPRGSYLNNPTLMKTNVGGNPNRHPHSANYPQQQQQQEQGVRVDRSGNAPFGQPHSSGSPSNNMPPHPVSAPVTKSFHPPHQGAVHQTAVSPKDDMAYTSAARQQRHPKVVAEGATRLSPQKPSNTDGNVGAPNSDGAMADSEQDLHFNHTTLLKSVTKLSPDTLNDSQVAASSTDHPLVTNANNISINNNSLASPIAQSTSAEDSMALPRMTLGDRESSSHHSAPARPESGNGNAPKPPPQPLASAFQAQSSTSQSNLVVAPRSADPLETSLSGTPGLGSSGVMRKRNNPYEPAPQRMASPTSPPQRPEAPNAAYNLSNSSFTGVGVNNSFINHLVANSPNASRSHRPVGEAGVGGSAYTPGSPLGPESRYQQGGFSQSHARAPSGNQHQHYNQSLGQRPPSRQTSYIGPAPEFSFTPLLGANNGMGNDSFNFDPVVFGSFAEHPDANAGNQGPAMSESFAMRPDIGSGRAPHQRHALHSGNRPNNAVSAGRWNAPGTNVGM